MTIRFLIFILSLSSIFAQLNYDNSGNILFGTINRTSDASLIKVPFRFINYKTAIEYNSFTLKSSLALEVSLSDETMKIDNRELYLSWYPSFGEVRFGKQINSWGVGSTNSPLDILTPVNYYYFFSRGIEKNMGTLSLAIDGYFADYKVGLVYLFEHSPHYLPLGDPEMPITIDSLPENLMVEEIHKPKQFGINFIAPVKDIDFTFSYFTGYDHLMSLFGASLWTDSINNTFGSYVDTVLSYRASEVFGIGASTFIGDIRINSEFAYYSTTDQINSDGDILRDFNGEYDKVCFPEIVQVYGDCTPIQDTYYGLGTTANYYEYLVEFEYPNLFLDITILGQFLSYKLLDISSGLHPNTVSLQLANIDFRPEYNFIPTLGSPIFMFTMHEDEDTKTLFMHEASVFYLNAKRYFMDHNLEANLRTFWDLNNLGNLIELEFKYKLSNRMNIGAAINKISGNSTLNNSYMFNTMENFSHLRVEATYNF
ncbi:MAG: hypothetical protein H8E72_02435 [Candidatus Marinimicrobia bacterium]|nr:hypothetical protein [Candidatus Neomarinimicrobiota bacterium]